MAARAGAILAGSPVVQTALDFAMAQQGTPYVWGGDGPAEGGYDCSGLTKAAYAAAGITIPRTAQSQYDAGPLLPPGAPLQPGDLIFYGMPSKVHHVGIAISDTEMISAPYTGTVVRVDVIGDYLAASRPTIQDPQVYAARVPTTTVARPITKANRPARRLRVM